MASMLGSATTATIVCRPTGMEVVGGAAKPSGCAGGRGRWFQHEQHDMLRREDRQAGWVHRRAGGTEDTVRGFASEDGSHRGLAQIDLYLDVPGQPSFDHGRQVG